MASLISTVLLLIISYLDLSYGTLCDETNECRDSTITDGAYCYGYNSCRGAKIDGSYANCGGLYACYDALEITSSGSVLCYGNSACNSAGSITAGTSVYCDGRYGCYNIENEVEADYYIYCDGDYSCRGITMESTKNTYCNGNYGCYYADVKSDDDIYCDGDYSCGYATLYAADNIYCYGKFGCRSSTMTVVDYLYAYGAYAAYGATISAERVYAFGLYAVAYSTLDSTDELAKNVYCYGYYGGVGADFICRSGSTCNLYCKGNCCYNMDFICLSGSTCSSSCSADGVSCPNEKTSISADQDAELLAALEDRKKDRENDEIYIAIQKEIEQDEKRFNDKMNEIDGGMKQKVNNNILGDILAFEGNDGLLSSYKYGSSLLIASISSLITFIGVYSYFAIKYKNDEYKSLQ